MSVKLFDTSAIINLCGLKNIEVLQLGATINLAFYEMGNAIWKHVHTRKNLNLIEGETVLKTLIEVFHGMQILDNGVEIEILRLASNHNLTFYDASFLEVAIHHNLSLVTDDKKLGKVAKEFVPVMSSINLS